ncbi:unnamed protein product, partial [marine sediment metagenome]
AEHGRSFSADGGNIARQYEGYKGFMVSGQENVNPFESLKPAGWYERWVAGVCVWEL